MAILSSHSSSKSSPRTPQLEASSLASENPSNVIPRSRSVQFSNSDPPMSRSISPRSNSHQQQQAESSADEITPIVNRERGGAKNKNYDSTSTGQLAESGEPGTSQHSSSSSARRRKGRQSELEPTWRQTADEEGKDGGSWWRELAEKYGSVELENKGSVARDHLALGMCNSSLSVACLSCYCYHSLFPSVPIQFHRLTLARTYVLGLASYLPRLRFHRHRYNPAFPAQYYHLGTGRLYAYQSGQYIPSTASRKATGGYFPRNCNLSLACWRQKVL